MLDLLSRFLSLSLNFLQWEIHQDLPYGTMSDDEMRKMNIGVLQDDGVIFLWVTGKRYYLMTPDTHPSRAKFTYFLSHPLILALKRREHGNLRSWWMISDFFALLSKYH